MKLVIESTENEGKPLTGRDISISLGENEIDISSYLSSIHLFVDTHCMVQADLELYISELSVDTEVIPHLENMAGEELDGDELSQLLLNSESLSIKDDE